jgi:uroporphyrin-III C-methyltransferase/precorrin-2 dehydrogenase/sirohydrochlorin ferrochelatase
VTGPRSSSSEGRYLIELDLGGRRVLVAGGGPTAARHVRRLAAAGADVLVVAPDVCEDVRELVDTGRALWARRDLVLADLDGAWLAHAATGSAEQDAAVVELCEFARIWCVAQDEVAGTARRPTPGRRPLGDGTGRVALVGGGPGDDGLITVRGLALIREADVVIVDRLAPWGVLDELDADVEVIDVGKTPEHHPVPQPEINRLLVEHARAGRRVVRLKGGDPFVLGRGGEELLACREAGVPVQVVPGVTSAFAVPAGAGIPVTHRGVSRSVTVLTGHDDPDHAALVRTGGTIVVLMGVARLTGLRDGLLRHGMAASTPVAFVERGWTPAQRTTRTVLGGCVEDAERLGVRAPAVLVIGAVAALDLTPAGPAPHLPAGVASDGSGQLSGDVVAAAVGPVTAGPLRAAGLDPLVPDRYRLGALVRAVADRLTGSGIREVPTPGGMPHVRGLAVPEADPDS